MRERILIVFIAIAIGLVITTLVYLLYQQTKTIPNKAPSASDMKSVKVPTPTNAPGYLVVSSPEDNAVVDRRTVVIKGTTHAEDTLIASTNQEDVVAKPSSDGKFSITLTIDAGANIIILRSIAPDGSERSDKRVITYSTEDF